MLKAWHKFKIFLHVQSTQTLRVNNLVFFKLFLKKSNVHDSFLKIGKDFNIND